MNFSIKRLQNIFKRVFYAKVIFVLLLALAMDSCAPINRDIGKVDRAISSDDETAVLHAVLDVALKEIDQQFNLLEVYACYIKMPDGKNPSDSFLAVHSFPIPCGLFQNVE